MDLMEQARKSEKKCSRQREKLLNEDREPLKPRKAYRIELGEREPPSKPRGEESRGARRKRRTITLCTSAVTSLGSCLGWGVQGEGVHITEWMEGLG